MFAPPQLSTESYLWSSVLKAWKKTGFVQFFHRFFSFFSTAMEKLGKIQKSTH